MRKVLTIVLLASLTLPAFTQELSKKEQRQLEKELKKEQAAKELEEKSVVVTAMVNHATFVLEAFTLRNKRGESIQVSSALNFVAVDSTRGILQIGDNAGIGANGVGGITVDGQVSDYKYTQQERSGSYTVSYYLLTTLGTYDVRLTAFPDGRADATISHSTWGGRITYTGYLVPPALSRVYKGISF